MKKTATWGLLASLVFIIFMLGGCKKEKDDPKINPGNETLNKLLGKWTWQSYYGDYTIEFTNEEIIVDYGDYLERFKFTIPKKNLLLIQMTYTSDENSIQDTVGAIFVKDLGSTAFIMNFRSKILTQLNGTPNQLLNSTFYYMENNYGAGYMHRLYEFTSDSLTIRNKHNNETTIPSDWTSAWFYSQFIVVTQSTLKYTDDYEESQKVCDYLFINGKLYLSDDYEPCTKISN